ncbi:MAG: RNA polymerase sigma factor [Propionibacteriaceae bacterium]
MAATCAGDSMLTTAELEHLFRTEYGRVVASVVVRFGDIDVAEEAVQEAWLTALQRWPQTGVPPNPGGWLTTTARNKAIDRLRRESLRERKHAASDQLADRTEAGIDTGTAQTEGEMDGDLVVDDRLRLIFTCCHPALAEPNRVALTLRLLGGLSVAEIARAYLVPETTMAQRIARSKVKIKANKIPYQVPAAAQLPERLAGVLAVLYLIFNEGYLTSAGPHGHRVDLADEAIRLTRTVCAMMPESLEAKGLLALMILTDARRGARFRDGVLVPLAGQDRSVWDAALIGEGHGLVRDCLRANRPGPYQLMAAVNAVHADAATADRTDWGQILALYDRLAVIQPTPVVVLNRAVAVAEVQGPLAALELVDALVGLADYHPYHATRADLLRRLGRSLPARVAYDRAIGLIENEPERAHLQRMRDQVSPDDPDPTTRT